MRFRLTNAQSNVYAYAVYEPKVINIDINIGGAYGSTIVDGAIDAINQTSNVYGDKVEYSGLTELNSTILPYIGANASLAINYRKLSYVQDHLIYNSFTYAQSVNLLGKDYYLQPNGRYKHSEKYIKFLAKCLRFEKCEIFDIDTRLEANKMVKGMLVILDN